MFGYAKKKKERKIESINWERVTLALFVDMSHPNYFSLEKSLPKKMLQFYLEATV